MFIKLTKSGPRRYVHLVEAYRDENGKPKQRTLASLGRYERVIGEVDSLISGLNRLAGRKEADVAEDLRLSFDSAKAFGDLYALQQLWEQLGFDLIRRVFRSSSRGSKMEQLLRVLVFNRLCDPSSKLGVLRWLETVSFPGVDTAKVTHQQLLRCMDALVDSKASIEKVLASSLRPLIDQTLSIVFYDLTTISVSGESELDEELRAFGRSKDGGIRRQVVVGLVQTQDGIPLAHEVFEGSVSEAPTLLPVIQRVAEQYPIKRVVVVADRGLLNLNNLEALEAATLPSGEPLEYILAVPGVRYGDFDEVVTPLAEQQAVSSQPDTTADGTNDWVAETTWKDRRLVVAHSNFMAEAATDDRRSRLETLRQQAAQMFGKLDEQDGGAVFRGRKLTDTGATVKFSQAVKDARLGHLIEVDDQGDAFGYLLKTRKLEALERLDGKLLLVTNVTDATPQEIVSRYKSLADIERGFRVLKSELEIGPMYHRLPDRIRAHAMVCFIALILHRVMRMRLRAAEHPLSPERTLELLKRIQMHSVKVNGKEMNGMSRLTAEQLNLLIALEVPKPAS